MTSSKKQKKPRGRYAIGYGKPPLHTRFAKGQSGNPGGRPARPQGTSLERARALALEEAYRTVTVKEDGRFVALPAIQAILRRQVALAAKGNGPAQRAVIAAVLAIEEEQATAAADQNAREPATETATDMIDAARRICFLLKLAECEQEAMAQAAREAPLDGREASVLPARGIEVGRSDGG
jgi:uncharacterized protein DUF5681